MNVKSFVLRLCIFAAVFLLVDYLSGFAFRFLDNHAGDKFARENFIRHEMYADVIIMGSSKAAHQYVPSILKDSLGMSVFNCGQRGNGIIYEYGRLATIYQRYTPKVIILDVIKGYDLDVNDNSRYLHFLKNDYGTNNIVDSLFLKIDKWNKYKMKINGYRYNSTICDLLINTIMKNRQRFQSDGYAPLMGSKLANDKTLKKSTKGEFQETDALKTECLERIVAEKKDNCSLVYVISPTYKIIEKKDYDIVRRICNKYDIPLLEYENDRRFVGKATYFHDGSHLNDEGAKYFTRILASDIKRILYIQPQRDPCDSECGKGDERHNRDSDCGEK